MTITFERRKTDFLNKIDKSNIGKWDARVVKLCGKLNKNEDYYSLSSCSGRIVLLKNVVKKTGGLFVFRSHNKVKLRELMGSIKGDHGKENLVFKQEPFILHVGCRDLKSGVKLLKKAQDAGLKHSGIIALSGNRVVLELTSSEQLAFPIVVDGKMIVDEDFLKIALVEANVRLERTWKKIKKLEKIA